MSDEIPLPHETIESGAQMLLTGPCDDDTRRLIGHRLLWAASLVRLLQFENGKMRRALDEIADNSREEEQIAMAAAQAREVAMQQANVVSMVGRVR